MCAVVCAVTSSESSAVSSLRVARQVTGDTSQASTAETLGKLARWMRTELLTLQLKKKRSSATVYGTYVCIDVILLYLLVQYTD